MMSRLKWIPHHPTITRFEQDIVAGTHRAWVEEVIQGADRQVEVLPSDLLPEFQHLRSERRYLEARLLLVPIRLGQHFRALREGTVTYDARLREWVTTLRYSSESGLDLRQEVDNIL